MGSFFATFARPPLQALFRRLLRARAKSFTVVGSAATLVLSPHPDDEALGCGGLIAAKRDAGIRVHICYLTDGSGSHLGHPTLTPALLARTREAEAREACRVLGVDQAEVTFLGACDGTLDRLVPAEATALADKIAAVLARVSPGELLLPCRADGSSEHEAVFRLVQTALGNFSGPAPRVLEFPVWAWRDPRRLWRPLRAAQVWRAELPGQLVRKRRAVAAHRSQVEPQPPQAEPALAPEFVSCFLQPEEYFFEW
jgi:LmbE family N-acetylglucosaminyl deacetylase